MSARVYGVHNPDHALIVPCAADCEPAIEMSNENSSTSDGKSQTRNSSCMTATITAVTSDGSEELDYIDMELLDEDFKDIISLHQLSNRSEDKLVFTVRTTCT